MIRLGSTVKFKADGRVYVRQIRPARDSYDREMVTPDSPMGQAMLDKKPGDRFEVKTPGGVVEVEIEEVKS